MPSRLAAALIVLIVAGTAPVAAEQPRAPEVFGRVFPEAGGFGSIAGEPPAAPAYRGGEVLGYVFFTRDVVGSVGFSGKPLDVAVGLDRDGTIVGAEIVEHHEPILVIGISDADLEAFVAQYRGMDVRDVVRLDEVRAPEEVSVDAVSGATVSSLAINDAVMRAARAVARGRGILEGAAAALDVDTFAPAR